MKLRKLLSLLAAAAMTVTALTGAMSVSAATTSGNCGEGVTWSFDSSTGKLTISGEGAMATPAVSETSELGDFPNTYTYKANKENIREVEIGEGVTSIGFCAFYQFPNLEKVVLPGSITDFGKQTASVGASYAFAECTKLRDLTLKEGMTDIGSYAFEGCTSLESVSIPKTIGPGDADGRDGWGTQTFKDCTSLKNITLPEGLTSIGIEAFANTAVESIVIPSTITSWPTKRAVSVSLARNWAFRDCAKLSSVTFAEGLKYINNSPFVGCPLLKRLVIPASVTDMSCAFTGTDEYHPEFEVAFEEGSQLTEIGAKAFYKNHLKALEIPESVTKVLYDNSGSGTTMEKIYIYSKTLQLYNLPYQNADVYCYVDSAAHNQKLPIDLEDEILNQLDDLDKAVKEANKYSDKEEEYTEESYGALKALVEKAATKNDQSYVLGIKFLTEDIYSAIDALMLKSEVPPSSDPESNPSDPSNPSDSSNNPSGSNNPSDSNNPSGSNNPSVTTPTTASPKTTANGKAIQAAKDKANAEKVMRQAKITKLTAKSKAKKKIVVSWKKVKNAKGYEVQVSKNNKFKKLIADKTTAKKKITIKSNKLKSKKTYYVRVRAYATYKDANGKPQKVYSSWIKKTRKVKVK